MLKAYIVYCILIVSTVAYSGMQGYVLAALFTGQGVAGRAANHYHK